MIKNLFNISDLSKKEILEIISVENDNKVLTNKNLGMIFEKYSTRTRLSFAVAISNLGGERIDIKFDELNFSRGESFADTFKTMNCYLDGLIYRTSNHDNLINASKYFKKPIINAMSDISHPCQILSDFYTLTNHFKKKELNILWTGDMNNVCFSLVELATIFEELNLYIYTHEKISSKVNWKYKKNIILEHNFKNINLDTIDCVMTDVFISMNDNEENHNKELYLKNFIVDSKLMNQTNKNCIFMHCLPAKIGSEVSKEVIEGQKSIVWQQAQNRMILQKKLLQCISW